jgi:hypothetical protein
LEWRFDVRNRSYFRGFRLIQPEAFAALEDGNDHDVTELGAFKSKVPELVGATNFHPAIPKLEARLGLLKVVQ